MRRKLLSVSREWWRSNPEFALATGWAAICGGLLMVVRIMGLV